MYDGETVYMFPNGELATKERMIKEHPAILTFPHYIITDINEEMVTEIIHVGQAKTLYQLDSNLSVEEARKQLELVINQKPEEPLPSPEERIAAALEFQNLMML